MDTIVKGKNIGEDIVMVNGNPKMMVTIGVNITTRIRVAFKFR